MGIRYKIIIIDEDNKFHKQSLESSGNVKQFADDVVQMLTRYHSGLLFDFFTTMEKHITERKGQQTLMAKKEVGL